MCEVNNPDSPDRCLLARAVTGIENEILIFSAGTGPYPNEKVRPLDRGCSTIETRFPLMW